MNVSNDPCINSYLVQLPERKEPEYFTTTSFLDTLINRPFKNIEFDTIQSKFKTLTEKQQFYAYQEVNNTFFGWKYFAPYKVLESLKDEEEAWYKSVFNDFYDEKDLYELKVKNYARYSYCDKDRDPSERPFNKDDLLTIQLKQEKFMTAQFCWWKRQIHYRYPEVWKKMEQRFLKNYQYNWLVDGGEIKDYIPRFLLNTSGYVQGVLLWVKLREYYGHKFKARMFEKWYTLWDCNIEILKKHRNLSIPQISWSNMTPTYHNADDIWLNVKKKIEEEGNAKIASIRA